MKGTKEMPPESTPAPMLNQPEARTPTGEIKDQSPPPAETTPPEPTKETSTPTTSEQKPPEEKPSLLNEKTEEPPKAEGAPEKYEAFKVPDGFELPEDTSKEVGEMFKKMNLPQSAAQELIDYYAKKSIEASEAPVKLWQDTQEKWVNEVKADPQLGPRLSEVRATIAQAIDGIGDPKVISEFKQAMDFTGAGNNPAFIRAFYALAKQVTEGDHVVGNNPSKFGTLEPGKSERPTPAKSLYPNLA